MATLLPIQPVTKGESIDADTINRPSVTNDANVQAVNTELVNKLNDSVTNTTQGWSSSKISTEIASVQGFVGTVRLPDLVSPLSGTTDVQQGVTLTAGIYQHVYSGINRTVRRFQLDVITGDFTTPIYEFTGDVDSHSIGYTLAVNTTYQWRCRDEAEDGNTSAWTIPQTFTTSSVFVPTPILSGSSTGNEDDDLIVTIDNYDPTGTYTIVVSAGTFNRVGANITWTLPSVTINEPHTMSVYMTDTFGDSSQTAVHNVTVLNVPIVGDSAIQITFYEPIQDTNDGFDHV